MMDKSGIGIKIFKALVVGGFTLVSGASAYKLVNKKTNSAIEVFNDLAPKLKMIGARKKEEEV